MRLGALLLMLYGQLLAPWLCCCTFVFGRSLSQGPPSDAKAASKECVTCCRQAPGKGPAKPTAPAKPSRPDAPCPVQFSKFIDRLPIKLDTEDPLGFVVSSWESISPFDEPIRVDGPVTVSQTALRPWMETRQWRIRVHHCLLC